MGSSSLKSEPLLQTEIAGDHSRDPPPPPWQPGPKRKIVCRSIRAAATVALALVGVLLVHRHRQAPTSPGDGLAQNLELMEDPAGGSDLVEFFGFEIPAKDSYELEVEGEGGEQIVHLTQIAIQEGAKDGIYTVSIEAESLGKGVKMALITLVRMESKGVYNLHASVDLPLSPGKYKLHNSGPASVSVVGYKTSSMQSDDEEITKLEEGEEEEDDDEDEAPPAAKKSEGKMLSREEVAAKAKKMAKDEAKKGGAKEVKTKGGKGGKKAAQEDEEDEDEDDSAENADEEDIDKILQEAEEEEEESDEEEEEEEEEESEDDSDEGGGAAKGKQGKKGGPPAKAAGGKRPAPAPAPAKGGADKKKFKGKK